MTDDLDAEMAEYDPDDPYPLPASDDPIVPPLDEVAALRMMGQLVAAERRKAKVAAIVQPELDRLTAFLRDRQAGLDRRWGTVARALEGWARASYERNPGKRIWNTPHGSYRLNPARGGLTVDDADAFLTYVTERGLWHLVTFEPNIGPLDTHPRGPGRYQRTDDEEVAPVLIAIGEGIGPLPRIEVIPGVTWRRRLTPSFTVSGLAKRTK